MDKTQQKVSKYMIRQWYSPVLFDVMCSYIIKAIDEINGSLKMSSKQLGQDSLRKLKNRMIREVLKSEKGRNALLYQLDSKVKRQKLDIIEEILKQYGIDRTEDSTLYFDEASIIFSEHEKKLESLIMKGNVDDLFRVLYLCEGRA